MSTEASSAGEELPDPQQELADLGAALAAHARRAAQRGVARARSVEAPAKAEVQAPVQLPAAVEACRACPLGSLRARSVCADGTGQAGVLFVGNAPGAEDEARALPFAGRAGQLLTDIIEKGMGLRREQVAITHRLKCRPPDDRAPLPEEAQACAPWLEQQIQQLQPRVLVALGAEAGNQLLGSNSTLDQLRGRVHVHARAKMIVTFHPEHLLRVPEDKKECWKDIQLAMRELGLPVVRK
jgi:DNA polymerase